MGKISLVKSKGKSFKIKTVINTVLNIYLQKIGHDKSIITSSNFIKII